MRRKSLSPGRRITNPLPRVSFESGAERHELKSGNFALICPTALRELAKIYQEGEEHYGPWNWTLGLPDLDTWNHLLNHLNIAQMGGDEEGDTVTHLAKAAWGIFAVIHFLKECDHDGHAQDRERRTADFTGTKRPSKRP